MPIDPFKTQVLLLHREQSTLDEFGARFGDRYTVHFATSGSQALSTLAETPINVIVSANDLPGMSGLEALREARKRSPDTIGILLTGNDEDSNEAFVGDEEFFHVVRGRLSEDSLLQLVDSATKKVRLMTLSKSANDTQALMSGFGEHAVMETADEGMAVSTSASGRMPALDPAKLASVRPVDVLVLTGDDNFRQTVEASSRGLHTVHSATTLQEANAVMQREEIGVAVIDAAIVQDKVEHLTQHLRKEVPRLVAVVAGRRDDGEMLMDLINRGKVYRFMMKPVTPGRARLAVEAAVMHHLEAPDAVFGVTEKTLSAAESETPPAGEEAPQLDQRIAADAAAVEPIAEEAEPSNEPVSNFAEDSTDAEISKAKPDTDVDLTSAPSSLDASQRMQKLAAARLEAQAAVDGRWPRLLAIGAAVVVIAAGAWLWFSGADIETPPPVEVPVTLPAAVEAEFAVDEPVVQEEVMPVDEPEVLDVDALLVTARAARDAGAIYEPSGSSAIELYRAAVIESEGAPLAVEEFEAVIGDALAIAETALLESRLDDAELALQRVGEADAGNVRLPFLAAQLRQARMLEVLSQARAAIRDAQLREAADLLEAAEVLQGADPAEIDAVAAELDRARRAQRTDRLLALADARLETGDLLVPTNNNARHYYELALTRDPDNKAARQGLKVIASRLILKSQTSIDSGDFDNAEMLLGEVQALDSQNTRLPALAERLRTSREAALARSAAAEQDAQSEMQARENALEEATLPADPVAPRAAAEDSLGSDDGRLNAAPVAVSSLVRTRYVAPKYPRSAQRRNLSGWVDIAFTVTVDGTVKDVEVRESEPDETFDNAARRAVQKWEFEPVLVNGAVIEQRAAVRMLFALE